MGLVKKVTSIDKVVRRKMFGLEKDRDTICRVCARAKSKTNISYVNVDQIDKLREKLIKYLDINMSSDDTLPKSICIKCFRMLNLFHEFVLMGRESQKILIMGCTDRTDVEKDVNVQTNHNIESFTSDDDQMTSGYDCDRCWFHCKDKKEFESHRKTHKSKDTKYVSPTKDLCNFICDKCPAEMSTWEQYKRHYWYNHTQDVVKCKYEECKDMIFQNRAKLRKHQQLKHKMEKPTCYFCNKQYSCKLTLLTHIRNVHQKCRTKKCIVCGKSFQTNYNLKTHMRTHTRIAQFSCPECTRPFVYKHIMKRHCEKIHGYTLDGQIKQNI